MKVETLVGSSSPDQPNRILFIARVRMHDAEVPDNRKLFAQYILGAAVFQGWMPRDLIDCFHVSGGQEERREADEIIVEVRGHIDVKCTTIDVPLFVGKKRLFRKQADWNF